MSKEVVFTNNAPAPVGAYSQAVKTGNLVFISGQIPIDPKTGELITDSFEAEAKCVLENLKAVIEAAGSSLEKTIKVNIYLKDMGQFAVLNNLYSSYFVEPYPARAVVEVARLPKDVNIEVEAIASL